MEKKEHSRDLRKGFKTPCPELHAEDFVRELYERRRNPRAWKETHELRKQVISGEIDTYAPGYGFREPPAGLACIEPVDSGTARPVVDVLKYVCARG